VGGTDDFNQDSHPDILWHNSSSGETQVWYMNGSNRSRGSPQLMGAITARHGEETGRIAELGAM
jgi:hypothetical protein